MTQQMQCNPANTTNSLWASEYITHWLEECSDSKENNPRSHSHLRHHRRGHSSLNSSLIGGPRSHDHILHHDSSHRYQDEKKHITRQRSKSYDHLESLCKSFATTYSSDTRRVHFSGTDTDNSAPTTRTSSNQKHKKSSPPPATTTSTTKVTISNLPWADENGILGKYTGEVSASSLSCLPHGHGFLVYSDGRTVESLWDHGVPIPTQDSISTSADKSGTDQTPTSPSCVKAVHCLSQKGDTVTKSSDKPKVKSRGRMILPKFHLGDIGSPQDMIIESNPSKAFQSIDSLKLYDFAWVKRSCGTWVYAIVAIITSDEDDANKSIQFVMDKKGSTKTLKSKYWTNHIRLVNMRNVSNSESLKKKQGTSCEHGQHERFDRTV